MTIPTREPTKAYCGDTIAWTKTLNDYEASEGWTLKYAFRSKDRLELTVTATADGEGYSATITPADSAALPVGVLSWAAFVVNADESQRYTVATGTIEILINPAEGKGQEPLSTARQALEAVNVALIENAARPEGSITFSDGRTVSYRNHAELVQLRNALLSEVRNEEKAAKIAAGMDSGANIRIRFSAS